MKTPKIRIFLFCPVPESQKPLNEFLIFQENSLFQWLTLTKKQYLTRLISLFIFTFFNGILAFFFPLFSTFFFSQIFICFLFFWIAFFRWNQLQIKFEQSRLFYEEGSWYDGQIWEKPLALIKNERFLTSQIIQPLYIRLLIPLFFYTFSFFFSLLSFF